jgi:hypothetical protein
MYSGVFCDLPKDDNLVEKFDCATETSEKPIHEKLKQDRKEKFTEQFDGILWDNLVDIGNHETVGYTLYMDRYLTNVYSYSLDSDEGWQKHNSVDDAMKQINLKKDNSSDKTFKHQIEESIDAEKKRAIEFAETTRRFNIQTNKKRRFNEQFPEIPWESLHFIKELDNERLYSGDFPNNVYSYSLNSDQGWLRYSDMDAMKQFKLNKEINAEFETLCTMNKFQTQLWSYINNKKSCNLLYKFIDLMVRKYPLENIHLQSLKLGVGKMNNRDWNLFQIEDVDFDWKNTNLLYDFDVFFK